MVGQMAKWAFLGQNKLQGGSDFRLILKSLALSDKTLPNFRPGLSSTVSSEAYPPLVSVLAEL